MKLTGKVAIVTGGASGLGRAVARRYAEEGAAVLIADIDYERARAVADDLSALGTKVVAQRFDAASEESVNAMASAAVEQFGGIDILVSNAGITTLSPFLELPVADWDLVMSVNLRGAFLCGQVVGRHMAGRGGGVIINMSSVEQDFGSGIRAHYVASKSGLKILTKAMALDLAPYGIRVNALAPGGFDTEINEKHFPDPVEREAFKAALALKIPLKRLGRPTEIGGAAVFLASDDASYVTGSVLNVDGGASAPVPSGS